MLNNPANTHKTVNHFLICLAVLFLYAVLPGRVQADTEGIPCTPEPTDMTIPYGSLVICAIDIVGDTDVFRFAANAGETVVIQVTRQSGGNPCIELYGPNGARIGVNCPYNTSAVAITATLAQTGTHAIRVSEYGNDATMGYALSLERIPSSGSTSAIQYGETINEALDPVGDIDLFRFHGNAGDTVIAQVTRRSGGNPCIELYGSNGARIGVNCPYNTSAVAITATLAQTGTHAIRVSEYNNDATMGYALNLQCVAQCSHQTDALVVDFGSLGIWLYSSTQSWKLLTALTATQLVAADVDHDGQTDLVVNFGSTYGIWVWQNNLVWVQLSDLSPVSITAADLDSNGQTDLVINFGSTYGIWVWQNNQTWVPLSNLSSDSITAADLDGNGQVDLVIDFGSTYGLWAWMNRQTWVKLSDLSPVSVTATDLDGNGRADLVVNFGPSYGLWVWRNNQTWVQLSGLSPVAMTAADLDGNGQGDLVINFGSSLGLWCWMNNQTWVKLADLSPVSITAAWLDNNAQQDLVIDFGAGYGLWRWMNNQSWLKLHDLSAKHIVALPE